MTTSATPSTRITVETTVSAPVEKVWAAYTTPEDIKQWNAASDDWHTTAASVDLRVGGAFSSRMEAKDGSFGFDFEGTYEEVDAPDALTLALGDGRKARTTFEAVPDGTKVETVFDAESQNAAEMQRAGWQAILDNYRKHAERA